MSAQKEPADQAFRTFLDSIISRVSGVSSIVISDRDGVVLTMSQSSADTELIDSDSMKLLVATFVTCCDQSAKSGLGKNQSIISFFENQIIVQFNALPLVISVAAEPSANIGLIVQLQKDLLSAVEPLRLQLLQLEKENSGM